MYKKLCAVLLLVCFLSFPATSLATVGTTCMTAGCIEAVKKNAEPILRKIGKAIVQAAREATGIDGLLGGALGSGWQAAAQKAPMVRSLGEGLVYGVSGTFLYKLGQNLWNEFRG